MPANSICVLLAGLICMDNWKLPDIEIMSQYQSDTRKIIVDFAFKFTCRYFYCYTVPNHAAP